MRWSGDREVAIFLDGTQNGGFETAKREVETVDFWNWKLVSVGIALEGGGGDGGATWVG